MRLATIAVCLGTAGCGRLSFDATGDASVDATGDGASLPSLVQQRGAAVASAATLSVTLDTAPAVGHVLVLAGAGHIALLTDVSGGSGTWARAASSDVNANIEIWYGPADGSSTITIAATGPTGMTLWVGEWSFLATTNTLDAGVATAGLASPASAGTITTQQAPELVLFAVNDFVPNVFGTPTDGAWTATDTQSIDSVQTVWFSIASAAAGCHQPHKG